MSIRATLQPAVNDFIANLQEFASGSYLKEEEKEFWDQPFDPAVLPELRGLLETYLDALDALGDSPEQDSLNTVAQNTLDALEKFNERHAGAVVEPEEKEEITELMFEAAKLTGIEDLSPEAFPEFE